MSNQLQKIEPKPVRIELAMSAADYRAADGIGKSQSDSVDQCLALFKLERDGAVEREETPAMKYGTQLHALVLDGNADYHIQPETYRVSMMQCPNCQSITDSQKCSKCKTDRTPIDVNKEWNRGAGQCVKWESDHADKPILTKSESDELHLMSAAILRHKHAAPLFIGSQSEVSLFGVHKQSGLLIKGRADLLNIGRKAIVDIKTTQDASNSGLSKSIGKWFYDVQAAWYVELAAQNGLDLPDFYFIGVERGTLLINVRRLTQADIAIGRAIMDKRLKEIAASQQSGIWPDYSGAQAEPGEIGLPKWRLNDTDGMELIGAEEPKYSETHRAETIDIYAGA